MVLESIALFIGASLILVKSASYSVKKVTDIARYFSFSEFFIAFAIAGLISIVPEFFIAINSSIASQPAVGLGTLIGSNIADLTIVIGIIVLVGRRIDVDKNIAKNNIPFLIVTSLPIFLMLDGKLTPDDGVILIMAFFFYIFRMFKKEKVFVSKKKGNRSALAKNIAGFVAAMSVLFLSAHFIVEAAINLSLALLIPPLIIGLFLVAFGTTLPELTFSLRAIVSKHKEIALGDILGNVAVDSTLTIGVLALMGTINTSFVIFATSALFMIFSALLVTTLLQTNAKITWHQSFIHFFLYGMFLLIELKGVAGL